MGSLLFATGVYIQAVLEE